MAIVGVDIGNITSIAVCAEKTSVIESRLEKATEINRLGSEDIFTYEGQEYVVNTGKFENNLLKFEKENFLTLMYYSIAKVTNSNSINLVTGIPASQYNTHKSEMLDFIKQNKCKSVIIDGLTRNIVINNVIVVPEGYSLKTFKYVVEECKQGVKTLVVDLGGGTTDTAEFDEGFKFVGGDSIKYGLLDLYRNTRKYINDKYDLNISLEDARKYFDGELELIDGDVSYKVGLMKHFIKTLINELRGLYHNLANTNIVITGGGAENVNPTFKHLFETILVKDIKANATGFYRIGVKKFE